MFNVSVLLLNDALLTCVVTKVVSFSIVAFKTLAFHKVVYRHTWGVVGSLATALSQMFSGFWHWNKFENRWIFDEVKAHKTVCQFFGQSFTYWHCHKFVIGFYANRAHGSAGGTINMQIPSERTEADGKVQSLRRNDSHWSRHRTDVSQLQGHLQPTSFANQSRPDSTSHRRPKEPPRRRKMRHGHPRKKGEQ